MPRRVLGAWPLSGGAMLGACVWPMSRDESRRGRGHLRGLVRADSFRCSGVEGMGLGFGCDGSSALRDFGCGLHELGRRTVQQLRDAAPTEGRDVRAALVAARSCVGCEHPHCCVRACLADTLTDCAAWQDAQHDGSASEPPAAARTRTRACASSLLWHWTPPLVRWRASCAPMGSVRLSGNKQAPNPVNATSAPGELGRARSGRDPSRAARKRHTEGACGAASARVARYGR